MRVVNGLDASRGTKSSKVTKVSEFDKIKGLKEFMTKQIK
jgi:hypothetical protein